MWHLEWLTPILKQQMAEVEEQLISYLSSDNAIISDGIQSLLGAGGKRIRPLLTLMSAQYGVAGEHIIEVATMPEMLHLATLIHDDIVDLADMRRGIPTLHKKYGADVAVFAGDFLLLSTTHKMLSFYDLATYKDFSADLMKILNAEILQMSEKEKWKTTLKTYFKVVEGKTARLLKLSVKLGAHYAHVPPRETRKLVLIAHNIGMAFQIIDDCIDYVGNSKTSGKPLYKDLSSGYMTLPVILKCRDDREFVKRLIQKKGKLSQGEIKREIEPYVLDAMKIAKQYSDKAIKQVALLPTNPVNQVWLELIQKLLNRKA